LSDAYLPPAREPNSERSSSFAAARVPDINRYLQALELQAAAGSVVLRSEVYEAHHRLVSIRVCQEVVIGWRALAGAVS